MSVFVGVQHLVHEVDITEVVARTALVLYLRKWITKLKKKTLAPPLTARHIDNEHLSCISLLVFPLSVVLCLTDGGGGG
jgi:hypothetical protein